MQGASLLIEAGFIQAETYQAVYLTLTAGINVVQEKSLHLFFYDTIVVITLHYV